MGLPLAPEFAIPGKGGHQGALVSTSSGILLLELERAVLGALICTRSQPEKGPVMLAVSSLQELESRGAEHNVGLVVGSRDADADHDRRC